MADFDCDGKAEMTCKTADGTVDGKGKVIGDASKDYRNSSGYVLSGSEYYTLLTAAPVQHWIPLTMNRPAAQFPSGATAMATVLTASGALWRIWTAASPVLSPDEAITPA